MRKFISITALAGASVNLVAPIVVDAETRSGAQILLDATKYSTQEPFLVRPGLEDALDDEGLKAPTGTDPA